MSRTKIILSNYTDHTLAIKGTRGTDWGDTVVIGKIINPGDDGIELGSIGDPGRTESDHWGWIYLNNKANSSDNYQYQVYVSKAYDEDPDASMGFYNENSNHDNPNPSPFNIPQNYTIIIDHDWDVRLILKQIPT